MGSTGRTEHVVRSLAELEPDDFVFHPVIGGYKVVRGWREGYEAASAEEASGAMLEWLFRLNYPFDFQWPSDPPPIDHRKLAAMWNERDDWRISDEDAYLCICEEAGIDPEPEST